MKSYTCIMFVFQYEYKSKGIKKKKVCLTISVEGIKVLLCKKRPVSIVSELVIVV